MPEWRASRAAAASSLPAPRGRPLHSTRAVSDRDPVTEMAMRVTPGAARSRCDRIGDGAIEGVGIAPEAAPPWRYNARVTPRESLGEIQQRVLQSGAADGRRLQLRG